MLHDLWIIFLLWMHVPDCRAWIHFFVSLLHPFFFSSIHFQAAKANLEKAQSELAGAADDAARAEVQISIEANEAIVKALE